MVNLNLPELIPIKQNFPRRGLADIPVTLRQVLSEGGLGRIIKPGQRVAVTAGSRGIANIVVILATIVAEIKKLGAEPRILAAMGSHGGGTKEGRLNILAGLGVTPAGVGAPVDAGDEPARAGILPSGLPLYYNRVALNYDAVILVNRVKIGRAHV